MRIERDRGAGPGAATVHVENLLGAPCEFRRVDLTAARHRSGRYHRARAFLYDARVSATSDPIDAPIIHADDRYFWDGVAERRLLIQHCTECGTLRHPPSPMCGNCGSLEWDTQEASGRGRVLTWILSRHPNAPDENAPRRGARRARRGRAGRLEPRRRAQRRSVRRLRRHDGDRRLPGARAVCCCPSSTRWVTRERRHDRRRHRPDRVLEGVGPQRAAARGRGVAGGDPRRRAHARRHRRHGHVHRSTRTTSSISCAPSASRRSGTGRARPTAARARTPPCSTRRSRSRPARRTRCSCTAPSTSGRAGASVNPCRSRGRRRLDWYLHVRARHAGEDVLALVPPLHARVRRDQRRLRPLHGRRPPSRGDQPERVVLPAADHARRPPGVALDRRAGAAAARLLSGERRRRGARRHHVPTAPRDLPQPAVRIEAAADAHLGNGSVMYNYYHPDLAEFPEARVPRPPALGAIGARARRHRRGDDLRELQPDRVLPARGVRLLRAGRGEGLHRRRQHRPRRRAARSTRTAACSARPTSTA